MSGPPLVLWLGSQGLRPAELRTSLSVCFLALNLVGAVALVVGGGTGALAGGDVLLPLLALVIVGHRIGAQAFKRIDPERFRLVVLGLVIATGLASWWRRGSEPSTWSGRLGFGPSSWSSEPAFADAPSAAARVSSSLACRAPSGAVERVL